MGTDHNIRSRRRLGVHALQCGAAVLAIVALTSCTAVDAAKGKAVESLQEGADRILDDGIQLVCNAPTAGSLRRRWGSSPEAVKKWQEFCDIALQSVAP